MSTDWRQVTRLSVRCRRDEFKKEKEMSEPGEQGLKKNKQKTAQSDLMDLVCHKQGFEVLQELDRNVGEILNAI